jgi:hypothetical protein
MTGRKSQALSKGMPVRLGHQRRRIELEIVTQRLYVPAARVKLNDGLCIQIHFGSQDQASPCAFLPLVVEELAPDGTHRRAFEEARHGDDRAQVHAPFLEYVTAWSQALALQAAGAALAENQGNAAVDFQVAIWP